MKTYSIKISSNIDSNVGKIVYFNSELNRGILLDILTPITPYKLTMSENDPGVIVIYGLEDVIKNLLETKLTTKVARNVTKSESEILAVFKRKPNFDLNIWEGNLEGIRTYVNNKYSIEIIKEMFPGLFKIDMRYDKMYYQGKLTLEYDPIASTYILVGEKLTDTVVYEEITLEK